MQAVDDGSGDAARFQDQPRHAGGERPAFADRSSNRRAILIACASGSTAIAYPIRAFRRATTASMLSPSARAVKVSAMRCLSTGSARSSTSSIEGARRPSSSARARTASISAWLARGLGPQAISLASPLSGPGRAERTSVRMASTTDSPTGKPPHQPLRRHQIFGGHRRLRPRFLGAGGLEQNFSFGVAVRIADVDLHQEAVELRFRQRIGAFLLQRVLRGEHVERLRQIVARAGDGDVLLLHRLQQRRLGARAGAVDLVGHQELGEDRTGDEAEAALAGLAFLQHLGAENVRRHQVGRELDAPRVEAEHDAHGLDELGLGETGHAKKQRVAAGQDGDESLLDDLVLAEYDGADRGLGGADVRGGRFGRAHDHVFELFEPLSASNGHS